MKKLIFTSLLLTFFLLGCNQANKEQTKSSSETETPELMEKTNTIDSAAQEIENLKSDIDESTEKLDKLLEDL